VRNSAIDSPNVITSGIANPPNDAPDRPRNAAIR
jgi:hypothetical protein